MKEFKFDLLNVEPTMTSLEIAEATGKQHRHVLRDCTVLNKKYQKLHMPILVTTFRTREIPNGGYKKEPYYVLTRMQTFDLMTTYSQELRIKVNRRWEHVERELKEAVRLLKEKPAFDFSDSATILKLAQDFHEETMKRKLAEATIEQQNAIIEKQAPKVRYHDTVISNEEAHLRTTTIALELGTSAVMLNRWLHAMGVIYRVGGIYNLYEKYINKGYAGINTYANGHVAMHWTQLGRKFIHSLAKEKNMFSYASK